MITCIRTTNDALAWLRRALIAALLATAVGAPTAGRADTVASLLGNFTINQYCGLGLSRGTAAVHYVVVFGQLPALSELHSADANGDGVTSQAERDAYVGKVAPALAEGLELVVNGSRVPLHATHWSTSLPTEQGGFSLRIDVDLGAELPAAAADSDATRSLEFTNRNYAGRMGWHEIVVGSTPGLVVFDTNAFGSSLTGGLSQALQSLPAAGPLDERSVHLKFGSTAPPGALLLTDRGGQPASNALPDERLPGGAPAGLAQASRPESGRSVGTRSESEWIAIKTRELVDAISSPHVKPGVALLALLGALLLGAVHALSPGHGKTIVGAYLVGSRGTPRHAAFLGLTVTITHTIGVFVLGFATLYASRFIVPERLFPILSLISAVLVLSMGMILLMQRGRAAHRALSKAQPAPSGDFRFVRSDAAAVGSHRLILAPAAQFVDATMHSHGGGPMHSHLPPGAAGEKISWRSLLTLGVSGGLVPCPSAMVLLLAAVALNKTAYGMLLVVAFSVGLAITLTLVGLAFLYARNRFRSPAAGSRWTHVLPVLSAVAILGVGIALCVGALRSFNA
jgi:ABC-type nickel/cobalt efflux system permease component RcnA